MPCLLYTSTGENVSLMRECGCNIAQGYYFARPIDVYKRQGWRIGYVAANKTIIDAIKKIQSQTTSATSAISQKAAVAALSGPQHDLEVMVAEFDKRRIYLLQRLAEMPGISCAKPRGAFYLLPDFSCYFGKKYRGREIKDAVDFANILLEAVLVALVPGEAFNIKGKVRLSYSNSMENLKEAMDKMCIRDRPSVVPPPFFNTWAIINLPVGTPGQLPWTKSAKMCIRDRVYRF